MAVSTPSANIKCDCIGSGQEITMDTKNEAPISVTSTVYYRGVSVLITKRDPKTPIKDLLESQIEVIDWMLDTKGAQPSWNMDTNRQVAVSQPTSNTIPLVTTLTPSEKGETTCPKCGNPIISGITKTGRKYRKCSTNKWNAVLKRAEGCEWIEWTPMTNADM